MGTPRAAVWRKTGRLEKGLVYGIATQKRPVFCNAHGKTTGLSIKKTGLFPKRPVAGAFVKRPVFHF